MQRLTKKCFQN